MNSAMPGSVVHIRTFLLYSDVGTALLNPPPQERLDEIYCGGGGSSLD
jgi:hypothetical protein